MIRRKVCVVTGTRAEYGLLYWLMKELASDLDFDLQIIVTGMHLSPEFGLTYQMIEKDGFIINEKVEMLLSSDTPVGVTKSIGLAVIGFADALERLKPDIMIVLGDRYEMLAAAQAALIARIPVAHIGGGDTTEGAFDEAIRHSITKMSHLHFVTNNVAFHRVRQLGETPERIYNVGNPGLDHLIRIRLLDKQELEETLGFQFKEKNILVTFHPATLEEESPETQFEQLLIAIRQLPDNIGVVFTKPNSDPGGRVLIDMLDRFVASSTNAKAYTSLGQARYLSLMAQVDAIVGNSSSGICEAPSLKKPTVDIGDRQRGRLHAASVIHCHPVAEEIIAGIQQAFALDCTQVINPYGDGNSSIRIVQVLKEIPDYKVLLQKHFFEVKIAGE